MDLEQRLNNAKSKLVKAFAERFGLNVVDIKMSDVDQGDFLGKPTSNEEIDRMVEKQIAEDVFIIASGKIEPQQPNHNPIQMMHTSTDVLTGETTIIDIKRRINVGDMVLMEYAEGVVETVLVEEIVDGIVYATGDDGEDFCAPVGNCDKVPF